MDSGRIWVCDAVARIEADFQRSADTHLIPLSLPGFPAQQFYLKDESIHPSASLKHRLARSLFLFGLSNGLIREGTTIVEASSGNTAVSEAYFARLLGLPFVAVMPQSTSPEKVRAIRFYGGECHFVDRSDAVYDEAARVAAARNGHYMDQFTNAERVTDWRSNNNIAESIFTQLKREPAPEPTWIICSAGTGGTSATIGRYLRYSKTQTQLCVVDPENSVFYDCWHDGVRDLSLATGSRIEGIGRPRCEPSFSPSVIDAMVKVPDAASVAALRVLESLTNRRFGGSTGAQFVAALLCLADMRSRQQQGSVVTLICDSGDRYAHTYFNEQWIQEQGLDVSGWQQWMDDVLAGAVPADREGLRQAGIASAVPERAGRA